MAALMGLVFNLFSPAGITLIRTAPAKVGVTDAEVFGSPARTGPGAIVPAQAETSGQAVFRVITLAQMKRAIDERRGMILDARTEAEFAASHIPGSMNLYANDPGGWVERVGELPRDTLMLVYCSNPHCPFGRTLIEHLSAFGFTNLLLYDEGWDEWSAAGLPSESGAPER